MMTVCREVLARLEKSYAVNAFEVDGRLKFFFASEIDAPCLCIDGETLKTETVWQQRGGTMAIVPLPGRNAEFLAIQGFYPPFAAASSKLVWVRRMSEEQWSVQDYLSLPYLHRFGLLTADGRIWLILATLCGSKLDRDDWSEPGSVYAAPLTDSPEQTPVPVPVLTGLFRNHGFYTGTCAGKPAVAVGSDQGVHLLLPPGRQKENWTIRTLTSVPTGEVWLEDLDGDGQDELVTIEAFHGSTLRVYHADREGNYHPVWQLPEQLEFAHALWCGSLWGQSCGVCGSRRGEAPLFRFFHDGGAYQVERLETGAAAANVWVAERNGKAYLLAANHGQNACVCYTMQ